MMIKQSLWVLLVAGFSVQGYAQDPNAQKFAEQITAKIAKKHLSILASDKFEGRETGKRGAELAAAYIANEFKKLKLIAPVNGSYIQNVPLTETSFEVAVARATVEASITLNFAVPTVEPETVQTFASSAEMGSSINIMGFSAYTALAT
jgi:hypothetical protein